MKRAQETALIIKEKTAVPLVSSEFFVEVLYTSRLLGMEVANPEAIDAIQTWYKNFHDPNFHLEDGENFADLKKRALDGLSYITQRAEEHIVVVSHAFFMWIIAAAVIYGDELTSAQCLGIMRGFDLMKNTGLTLVTFEAPMRKAIGELSSPWQLVVWNDHAHLG